MAHLYYFRPRPSLATFLRRVRAEYPEHAPIHRATPLEIPRYVYSTREKQAAEYIPTDEQLQLPAEEQSYVLEDWSQRLTTNQPYAEARNILRELLGIEISVRALEHMNQRLAKHVNPYSIGATEQDSRSFITISIQAHHLAEVALSD